jgi:hypothetical protein
VDNESAVLGCVHEHLGFLPGNHSDMIKFSQGDDTGYERVLNAILDIIDAGPINLRTQGA